MAACNIYPGYFAMVMATGILSIGMEALERHILSTLLLWAAVSTHVILVAMLILRLRFFPDRVRADLTELKTTFTFFTFVAANGVLGVRFFLAGHPFLPNVLWAVAAIAWVVLIYYALSRLFFANTGSIPEVVNPGWLIAVVGSQSIATLGAILSTNGNNTALLAAAYLAWSVGVLLYGIIIFLVFQRFAFFAAKPADFTPPFWINMGAVAISSVAGAQLTKAAPQSFLAPALPFLYGATLVLWSWATWWIPFIVIIGIWKYGVHRQPLHYEPTKWSIVFPLGMYTVATLRIAEMTQLPVLHRFAESFSLVALFAWLATFIGLLRSWGSRLWKYE